MSNENGNGNHRNANTNGHQRNGQVNGSVNGHQNGNGNGHHPDAADTFTGLDLLWDSLPASVTEKLAQPLDASLVSQAQGPERDAVMMSPALGAVLLRLSVPGSSRLLTAMTTSACAVAPWASVAVTVAA